MKTLIFVVFAVFGIIVALFIAGGSATAAESVEYNGPYSGVCDQLNKAQESSVCTQNNSQNPIAGDEGIVIKATRILAVITGVASVIAIIIGGLQFVTSGGSAERVSTAKSIILYAVIGLVVAILAQALVALVLSRI